MPNFATLYFPGVTPLHSSLAALLLLHDEVWSYSPSEGLVVSEELQRYSREGLLKIQVPAPLGADKKKFDRIIQDFLIHGEDFLGASRFALADRENVQSGWDIVSSLIGNVDKSEKDQDLWQARILLGLQEKLDQQEREIDRNLTRLAAKQDSLINTLRLGEERAVGSGGLEKQTAHSSTRDQQLLRAWSKLYFHDDAIDRPIILATDQSGIFSLLLIEYEKFCHESPQELMKLALPDLASMAPESFPDKHAAFRDKASACIKEVRKAFSTHADSENVLPTIPDLVQEWRHAVEESFQNVGRRSLAVYRFAGLSTASLLARCAKLEEEKPLDEQPTNGFLVVTCCKHL